MHNKVNRLLKASEIMPLGWMKSQLEVQGKGLAGNLDNMWPDVRDSKWLGGTYEGWERFPYFLDGLVSLAYLLDDISMKQRVERYIDTIIASQDETGKIAPRDDTDMQASDLWSIFLVLKVLTSYSLFTGSDKAQNTIYNGLVYLSSRLCRETLKNWAAARWYECLIPILYIVSIRPEPWLFDFALRLKSQGIDFDEAKRLWEQPAQKWNYEAHVVNAAMSIKAEALYSLLTGSPYRDKAETLFDTLMRYHGNAYGHFNGDECLAGRSPVRGSELCGVVEAMYSYEVLSLVTGDAKWGDRLESLAFNGLPAAITGDMWAHQYDQQVNQIAAIAFEGKVIFETNGKESNMFGLEPHFGCCTANFGQGWPKFARAACTKTPDDKLAIISPVPMRIETILNNRKIALECASDYPFKNSFLLIPKGDFTVRLRVPNWAEGVSCDGKELVVKDGWTDIDLFDGIAINIEYAARPRLERRGDNSACLKYGALLFSLPIPHIKKQHEYVRNGIERKHPYCDYSFETDGEWAFAFDAALDVSVEIMHKNLELPYNKETPPVTLVCNVVPIKWGFKKGYEHVADDNLVEIIKAGERRPMEFVPYGATYLRITELPIYDKTD